MTRRWRLGSSGGSRSVAQLSGVAEATATIMAQVGAEEPPLRAIPALPVTRGNVLDAYPAVPERPVPPGFRQAVHTAEPQ